jgi:hypothetical protein
MPYGIGGITAQPKEQLAYESGPADEELEIDPSAAASAWAPAKSNGS